MNQALAAVDSPALLVLDTNVWLDWIVFDDVSTTVIRRCHDAAIVRVAASARLRDEFDCVIRRPALKLDERRQAACLAAFDRIVSPVDDREDYEPAHAAFAANCTDPDDRKFITFALHHRATALLTRDRAVLKLARRAANEYRLLITTLPDWDRLMLVGPAESTP